MRTTRLWAARRSDLEVNDPLEVIRIVYKVNSRNRLRQTLGKVRADTGYRLQLKAALWNVRQKQGIV